MYISLNFTEWHPQGNQTAQKTSPLTTYIHVHVRVYTDVCVYVAYMYLCNLSIERERNQKKHMITQSLIHCTERLPSSKSNVITFYVMLTLDSRLSATAQSAGFDTAVKYQPESHLNLQPRTERPFQPFELNMGSKSFR